MHLGVGCRATGSAFVELSATLPVNPCCVRFLAFLLPLFYFGQRQPRKLLHGQKKTHPLPTVKKATGAKFPVVIRRVVRGVMAVESVRCDTNKQCLTLRNDIDTTTRYCGLSTLWHKSSALLVSRPAGYYSYGSGKPHGLIGLFRRCTGDAPPRCQGSGCTPGTGLCRFLLWGVDRVWCLARQTLGWCGQSFSWV